MDILDLVGLRSGDIPDSLVSIVPGPSGLLDAFSFQEELNTTTDDQEWELIGQDFPSQFGLYTVFNASEYEGSIFSVISKTNDVIFDVSLWRSEYKNGDDLVIMLPGLSEFTVEIPASVNFRDQSSFQTLGIRLFHYQLLVIIDCIVVNFVNLEEPPLPLPVEDNRVEVFSGGATVSSIQCGKGYKRSQLFPSPRPCALLFALIIKQHLDCYVVSVWGVK